MTPSAVLRLSAFGLDHLAPETVDLPAPGPTEVLVQFHAASLNYRDLMVVLGNYNPKMHLPRIPGSDAAGEILAVGDQVTRLHPGDRVASLFFPDWHDGQVSAAKIRSALGGSVDGVFATTRLLPETALVPIPPSLSFAQAATLPCAALTAWNALIEKGGIHAGQTVLLLGTGGVSLFALQFAKAHGATVLITSSSDQKLERARTLGADHTINYRSTPDWETEVLRLTDQLGVDHVVEVGGAGTLPRSLKAVRVGGYVYIIGILSDPTAGVNILPVLSRSIHMDGVYVGSRAMFTRMNTAIEANRIVPVVDQTFPLSEARAAFEHMQNGRHFGKIVLDLDASRPSRPLTSPTSR